eukprot:CAMPEP_0197517492 /NCGR_PEP_ID=MMETSP1318-20131121/2521_1 /TAXON_ID=552666 /ORGANISM="Partenskyella glossopodia, Strain RCC365" /LENGTH=247 /DNA_ID=CAMNT_0043067093 /DNA_START=77 /DNA_END=820 /DNA_ORIENTATION=+
MKVMLSCYEDDPQESYPNTIEQTARCLGIISEEKAKIALKEFSEPARLAVECIQKKIASGALKTTPRIDRNMRRTPYRTPNRRKSVHWVQFIDEKSKLPYYENQLTGEVTWECPKAPFQVDGYDFVEWEEGAFTEEEFLAATQRAFDMIDKDHDGTINEDDLKEFLARTNHEDQWAELKLIMHKISDIHGFRALWDAMLENYGSKECSAIFKSEFGFPIISEEEIDIHHADDDDKAMVTPISTPKKE